MSESTEELATAVKGATESLAEIVNLAEQLSAHATEFTEEAAGHGWHGMATRMEEAGEALTEAAAQLATSRLAGETAGEELGLINDKIPAEQVVAHLTTSTTELADAMTALEGAVAKVEEAQTAVGEIGQEGMMQAISDLYDQVSEVQIEVGQHQATSESERVAAEEYAKKNPGN